MEIRMAIAKITAVGDVDWTIGVGSIGAIVRGVCWVKIGCT
jgi:hypothetical protein